jgi:O-antigen/teichoic acid export membrane protein
LSGKASRALGWSFGSTLLNKLSLFGIGIMLARLLGPHAFGTYAVAYVAMTAVLTFNELGVSLAIVRWEGDPREIVPTVTTISMLVSAVVYAGCFFGAPAYASAMGTPAAASVVRVLAILVLVDGFTGTPAALLQRTFRQGRRTIADQVNVWLGTGVTVVLAWSGYGAMSLAIGRLAGCVAGAVLLAAFAPESLHVGFHPAKARALLRFGLPLAGSNLIALAVVSVDQLVVGHLLGAVALGFYVLALNLASWPITMFSQPVANVAPAVFSRLQRDRAAMRTTFVSAAALLCAVAAPVCLLIGGSAGPLIGFVYGSRWLPAAQPLLWLAVLGAVQVFFLLAFDYLVVLARSRFLLIVQLLWLLALVPALIAGARTGGIYGASLAEIAVAALGVLPWYLRELSKVGIRLRSLGRHLCLPMAGAALAGLISLAAAKLARTDFVALTISGVAAVVIIGVLAYRMRRVLALLRSTSAEPSVDGVRVVAVEPAVAAEAIVVIEPAVVAEPAVAGAAGASAAPADAAGAQDHPVAQGIGHAPPARYRDKPCGGRMSRDAVLGRPTYHDVTVPIPLCRELLGDPPVHPDPEATVPLHRITVTSLDWDPGNVGGADVRR